VRGNWILNDGLTTWQKTSVAVVQNQYPWTVTSLIPLKFSLHTIYKSWILQLLYCEYLYTYRFFSSVITLVTRHLIKHIKYIQTGRYTHAFLQKCRETNKLIFWKSCFKDDKTYPIHSLVWYFLTDKIFSYVKLDRFSVCVSRMA
jgi:hypothetical protein